MVFPEWITLSRFYSSLKKLAYHRIVKPLHDEPTQF
jgi:hypothetical protein